MTQWNVPREVIESENDTAKLRAHISTLESELQQVKVERDGLSEALKNVMGLIESGELVCNVIRKLAQAQAALTPAPAAKTETK